MRHSLFAHGNLIFFSQRMFLEKKSRISLNEKKFEIRREIVNINMRKILGRPFTRIKVKFTNPYILDKTHCNEAETINFCCQKQDSQEQLLWVGNKRAFKEPFNYWQDTFKYTCWRSYPFSQKLPVDIRRQYVYRYNVLLLVFQYFCFLNIVVDIKTQVAGQV